MCDGNKLYLIDSDLKYSIAKQKIEVHKLHDGDFNAYFAGRHLTISEAHCAREFGKSF